MAAIDAISRYEAAPQRVGRRRVGEGFIAFARLELPSFADAAAARALYDRYRNGLAHEARLKDGAEFSLDVPETFTSLGQVMRINPSKLINEVRDALSRFVTVIAADPFVREQFSRILAEDFAFELTGERVQASR